MIRSGELSAENLEIGVTQEGTPTLLPKPVYYLQQNGYTIEGIDEVHTVDRDTSDTAHVVMQIQTYQYPRDDSRLDVAEHGVSVWVCDCGEFVYRQWPDLREDYSPVDAGSCVHIQEVSKVERAQNDENQETL